MLDFTSVVAKQQTIQELANGLGTNDLRNLTNEMIDQQLAMIAGCENADVVFVPSDPLANDTFASTAEDIGIAWTLGHVIVHITASSEESAALAAELARGVAFHGRSRSEVPWQSITTVAQCRARLEESRWMRLASLDMWPAHPYLDNRYEPRAGAGVINAMGRFVSGLRHDNDHLGQIADVVEQARTARGRAG